MHNDVKKYDPPKGIKPMEVIEVKNTAESSAVRVFKNAPEGRKLGIAFGLRWREQVDSVMGAKGAVLIEDVEVSRIDQESLTEKEKRMLRNKIVENFVKEDLEHAPEWMCAPIESYNDFVKRIGGYPRKNKKP
jgi:hypothetical protein